MFDTPQEAALKAENARLRAENDYLRSAVEAPGVLVTPYATEEEMLVREVPVNFIRLPSVGGIRGTLLDDRRWHVMAYSDRMPERDDLRVSYFAPGWNAPGMSRQMFVNDVLPRMHVQFIRQLSEILMKS